MRLRCANSISTFFLWRREAAGQVTRASVDGASDLAGRQVGRSALPQGAAGTVLLADAITDEAILTDIAAGLHKMRLRGRRRLSDDLVNGESTFAYSAYTRGLGENLPCLYQRRL